MNVPHGSPPRHFWASTDRPSQYRMFPPIALPIATSVIG
jgi:hypothetical protein